MATKDVQDQVKENLENYSAKAKAQAEEAVAFGKDSYEAWLKTTTIVMEGTQDMFKYWTNSANKAREKNAAALKTFMSCKTLNDMTETGVKIAQQNLEDTMSSATELSEKTVRLCMDALEPLNEQFASSLNKRNTAKAA